MLTNSSSPVNGETVEYSNAKTNSLTTLVLEANTSSENLAIVMIPNKGLLTYLKMK